MCANEALHDHPEQVEAIILAVGEKICVLTSKTHDPLKSVNFQ